VTLPHQSALFLRLYGLLPHGLLNATAARLARAQRPRPLVQAAVQTWIRRGRIDLGDFERGPFPSVEAFFLRRLRPGVRPLGDGMVVSPVDGVITAAGDIRPDLALDVKGHSLSVERLLGGARGAPAGFREDLRGGSYAAIFLTPNGYHYVHAPASGRLEAVHWLPGRFFPQNERALSRIPRVYERNERAVLRCATAGGAPYFLVMVGASLIGGIHLEGLTRAAWTRDAPTSTWVDRALAAGDVVGHFTFGSTVVLLLPPGAAASFARRAGETVRMGETLFRAPKPRSP